MNKIKQSILAIVIGLALAGGVSFAETLWNGPTDNPPRGNTDAPINVSPTEQIFSKGKTLKIKKDGSGILDLVGGLNVNGPIHAVGDVCTDEGGGRCLSAAGGGTGFYHISPANFIGEFNSKGEDHGGKPTTVTYDLSQYVPGDAQYGYFFIALTEGDIGYFKRGDNVMAGPGGIVLPDQARGDKKPNEYTVNWLDYDDDVPSSSTFAVVKLSSDKKVTFKISSEQSAAVRIYLHGYYK